MSENCAPLWLNAHLEVNMYKTCGVRSTFGSSDAQKSHAAVAKSTCAKHVVFGALLEVLMSNNCTAL